MLDWKKHLLKSRSGNSFYKITRKVLPDWDQHLTNLDNGVKSEFLEMLLFYYQPMGKTAGDDFRDLVAKVLDEHTKRVLEHVVKL